MHNHHNEGSRRMMWIIIPCVILLGILFIGGGKFPSSGYFWLILLGVCVIPHIWMMFRGHESHGSENEEEEPKNEHNKTNF